MTAETLKLSDQYTVNDYIPSTAWGKDHWSTLAYVDHVMAECAGFQVGQDGRMRCNRRHFRVMNDCPRPKRASRPAMATVMAPEHSSRLKDGSSLAGHDDWNCVQDMAQEGLFTMGSHRVEPGTVLHWSDKGRQWAQALREHKQAGGSFAAFELPSGLAATTAPPRAYETFEWIGMRFDITLLLADLDSGKLKPHRGHFDPEFVAEFARKILAVKREERDAQQSFGILGGVDYSRALALPDEVLKRPVVLVYAGKNKGVLNFDGSGPNYLLADGNHRMARHYLDDRKEDVPMVWLSPAQSRRYKM